MSEHNDSADQTRGCPRCGSSVHYLRCHHCDPVQAPDRDEFLAEWASRPAAERLERIPGWIEALVGVLALNLVSATPDEARSSAKRLGDFVKLAGDGDLELGVERLKTLTLAQRLVA
jgi:hypothetical protein